ncbi:EutP/PduV family microcompartment system protein [Caloramator sp. Dgby_cultured_2]|nr:EutP/PduV family microcompartment system protein [Caloramator sp. Dgby_cultured_2]WDU82163.1 EutP/PduV family microcompartment system protein [Caloramator sp. Dgby_cultured_2]
MLIGKSGCGKTTLVQALLQNEFFIKRHKLLNTINAY